MNRIYVNTDTTKREKYPIGITRGFDELADELKKISFSEGKIIIVSDENVANLYINQITSILSQENYSFDSYIISEEHKSIDFINDLSMQINSISDADNTLIIALGGSTVLSLVSISFDSLKNNCKLMLIPTNFTAITENSIKGKYFINNCDAITVYPEYVYINIDTINSLSNIEFYKGFAYIMRNAIIKSSSYYVWILDNMYEIKDREADAIEDLITKAITNSKILFEKDSEYTGISMSRYFGESIADAIYDQFSDKFNEGEALTLGMICSAFISWKMEFLSMDEFYEIRDMFVPFNLPISLDKLDINRALEFIHINDTRMSGSKKFVLIKSIGKALISCDVNDDYIKAALEEINFIDEF